MTTNFLNIKQFAQPLTNAEQIEVNIRHNQILCTNFSKRLYEELSDALNKVMLELRGNTYQAGEQALSLITPRVNCVTTDWYMKNHMLLRHPVEEYRMRVVQRGNTEWLGLLLVPSQRLFELESGYDGLSVLGVRNAVTVAFTPEEQLRIVNEYLYDNKVC